MFKNKKAEVTHVTSTTVICVKGDSFKKQGNFKINLTDVQSAYAIIRFNSMLDAMCATNPNTMGQTLTNNQYKASVSFLSV